MEIFELLPNLGERLFIALSCFLGLFFSSLVLERFARLKLANFSLLITLLFLAYNLENFLFSNLAEGSGMQLVLNSFSFFSYSATFFIGLCLLLEIPLSMIFSMLNLKEATVGLKAFRPPLIAFFFFATCSSLASAWHEILVGFFR